MGWSSKASSTNNNELAHKSTPQSADPFQVQRQHTLNAGTWPTHSTIRKLSDMSLHWFSGCVGFRPPKNPLLKTNFAGASMNENEQISTQPKIPKLKFIGLWAVAGQIFGMVMSDQMYGFTGEVVAYKLGAGLPFALIGAAIGALAHYFFRSGKK